MFVIDVQSGRLILTRALGGTAQANYVLTVMASDTAIPPNTDTARVRKIALFLVYWLFAVTADLFAEPWKPACKENTSTKVWPKVDANLVPSLRRFSHITLRAGVLIIRGISQTQTLILEFRSDWFLPLCTKVGHKDSKGSTSGIHASLFASCRLQ